jgi:hypothetical protein
LCFFVFVRVKDSSAYIVKSLEISYYLRFFLHIEIIFCVFTHLCICCHQRTSLICMSGPYLCKMVSPVRKLCCQRLENISICQERNFARHKMLQFSLSELGIKNRYVVRLTPWAGGVTECCTLQFHVLEVLEDQVT